MARNARDIGSSPHFWHSWGLQMDMNFVFFVVGRFILSLGFLAVGFLSLMYGVRLFSKGVGSDPDNSVVVLGIGKKQVEVSLRTVGSVVLATSVAWGSLAYLTLPKAIWYGSGNSEGGVLAVNNPADGPTLGSGSRSHTAAKDPSEPLWKVYASPPPKSTTR